MTSGEYIKHIITAKNISVSELCKAAGIKSRNTVYRLFNNYHSEAKSRERNIFDITIPENGRSGDRRIFLSQIDRVELHAKIYKYVQEL